MLLKANYFLNGGVGEGETNWADFHSPRPSKFYARVCGRLHLFCCSETVSLKPVTQGASLSVARTGRAKLLGQKELERLQGRS